MGFLFRSAVFVGFLALAFAAGYWLGDHRLDDVADRFAALKGDLAEKTASLDRDVAVLKRRAALAEARDAVNRAGEALGKKNFGDAEREIALALERVRGAAADAGADAKAALERVRDALEGLRRDVRAVKPRVEAQLRRIARQIDELAQRWD